MSNPYQALERNKFWRTGVSQVELGDCFERLWVPKYKIKKQHRVITVGSCFAQHISRWLIANGYNWLEGEKKPEGMSDDAGIAEGYGVFSFRTGNIYTPALLRQWLSLALGECEIGEFIYQDGRYYDPLRPNIPLDGFENKEDLTLARTKSLSAILACLLEADVFIFTLGLTEVWKNKAGYVYPVCPGTIKGVFDTDVHSFKNYSHSEVVDDLNWIISTCTKLNPRIKFLLTVSPVPLTATATERHVLSATNYSKAILRSAAGAVADAHECVDYFPSYELITSVATRQVFYDANLRTVRPEGVAYVMAHFAGGVSCGETGRAASVRRTSAERGVLDPSEEVCEDILLETWNSQKSVGQEAEVCLIGDSHMGLLSKAFERLNVAHAGGMIMSGSAWTSNLFHIDEEEILVPLEDAASRRRWAQTLPFFQAPSFERRIILNIGLQTHRSVGDFDKFIVQNKITTLNPKMFADYYARRHRLSLEVAKKLIRMGYRVIVIGDPPTRSIAPPAVKRGLGLFLYFEKEALYLFKGLGCEVLETAEEFGGEAFKSEYFSDTFIPAVGRDWWHGSDNYYLELGRRIITKFLI